MNPRTPLEWARAYASLGWRVYPVAPGTKRPMFDDWIRDATVDTDPIARHWRPGPGAPSMGVIAGEAFDVVDVEAAHVEAFRRAVIGHGLPDGPIARSGRGGIHGYVAPIGTGTHRLVLDGVHVGEWKGSGGVLVPPSRTVGAYAWLRSPLEHPRPQAPAWLRALAVVPTPGYGASCGRTVDGRDLTPSRAVAIAHGLFRVVAEAALGDRNATLFWAACRAKDHGLQPAAVADILVSAAVRAGLPEREARLTIASGFRR